MAKKSKGIAVALPRVSSTISQLELDEAHWGMDIFSQPITQDVWREKYSLPTEKHPDESMLRVCNGIYAHDDSINKDVAVHAMRQALWVPGGRIHAGGGTQKVVTLMNCYVCRTIPDSMQGIMDALTDAALTQQQGGGIGMDFSTLRPRGAYLARTQAIASGPIHFMDMWNAMCSTIMSAGNRRGAMMATMSDDHPDLPEFITAKREKGRLTNFNVSVLVTDAFMQAVMDDEMWDLGFHQPRADGKHVGTVQTDDGPWYIYTQYKARELWEMITRNTYEYSEPGVIFIDKINDQNNLKYVETIRCTNPCGEQPLPPNGACNLGAVNLSRMVRNPFLPNAKFDFDLLSATVRVGVRFLDNVIDVTNYPLPSQNGEETDKRRIGVGITGLGNALAELCIPYGTEEAILTANKIMQTIAHEAYRESALLASERGSFPLYDEDQWGLNNPVVQSLPTETKELIKEHGIRNGVLLTIAPTGTTSLYMGNVSSGLEPVFLFKTNRKVRQADGVSWKDYTCYDYGYLLWMKSQGIVGNPIDIPAYLVDHTGLSIGDHLRMQAVCQQWVDASVSKTINVPQETPYEEFKLVYREAYQRGCKGCTTYRPSDVRGSILSAGGEASANPVGTTVSRGPVQRAEALEGVTYKVKWPNDDAAFYVTINNAEGGTPFEIFINSTSTKYTEWTTALSLMISAMMRQGIDTAFVPEELKKVVSYNDSAWIDGKFYGSLVARIGGIIADHLGLDVEAITIAPEAAREVDQVRAHETCPKCNNPTLVRQEGCKVCINCSYSSC